MNLLLDTHVFLWAVDDDPKLSKAARAAIIDGRNLVYVSAVTAWEIALKRTRGTLRVPSSGYLEQIRLHRFIPLSITADHALAVESLPMHHKDPFDRMLVVQAREEGLTLITHDRQMTFYDVKIIAT